MNPFPIVKQKRRHRGDCSNCEPLVLHVAIYPATSDPRGIDFSPTKTDHPTTTRRDTTQALSSRTPPIPSFLAVEESRSISISLYIHSLASSISAPLSNRHNVQERVHIPCPSKTLTSDSKANSWPSPNRISGSPKQKLKSSAQRALRQALLTTYPLLNPYIDEILPKKASLASMKLPDRNTLYVLDTVPLFYQQDTSEIIPHLRLVHRFPDAFPSIRIDRGAIRFVLSGATLMAPGLTSAGGRLPADGAPDGLEEGKELEQKLEEDGRWSRELQKGEPVVVMAEGKEEACAVGTLVAGTKEVKAKGKGPVIEDAHFLGDGLWNLSTE
ncbi:hypothetical protein FDECE_5558 [Fusarium decemcellulare]|nr:hypothetical protein FDECE_5558 [Fusarium decemcellulare]